MATSASTVASATVGTAGTAGRIHRIGISPRGGVPKPEVARAELTAETILGNAVANPRVHGGPDRVVCLYALERIEALRAEGHPITAGAVGENVTVEGLDWTKVIPGARLKLGAQALIEITDYAGPCKKIAAAFADGDSLRIHAEHHPGWARVYARVLAAGGIATGDAVTLI
jgi:MOSC domain-containing protein YiiM